MEFMRYANAKGPIFALLGICQKGFKLSARIRHTPDSVRVQLLPRRAVPGDIRCRVYSTNPDSHLFQLSGFLLSAQYVILLKSDETEVCQNDFCFCVSAITPINKHRPPALGYMGPEVVEFRYAVLFCCIALICPDHSGKSGM